MNEQPAPAEPANFALQWSENRPPCEEWWRGSVWYNERVTLGKFRSIARAVLARWGSGQGFLDSSAPEPAEEVAELVAWLRETGRLLSRRPDIQCRVDLRLFDRAADLLQQQAAELAECREALRRVRLEQRIPGGFW